jgi:hypothetical protein
MNIPKNTPTTTREVVVGFSAAQGEEDRGEIDRMLKDFGIGKAMRKKILAIEGITAQVVRYCDLETEDSRTGAGLLIDKLLDNAADYIADGLPDDWNADRAREEYPTAADLQAKRDAELAEANWQAERVQRIYATAMEMYHQNPERYKRGVEAIRNHESAGNFDNPVVVLAERYLREKKRIDTFPELNENDLVAWVLGVEWFEYPYATGKDAVIEAEAPAPPSKHRRSKAEFEEPNRPLPYRRAKPVSECDKQFGPAVRPTDEEIDRLLGTDPRPTRSVSI